MSKNSKKTTITNPMPVFQVRRLTVTDISIVRLASLDFMANSEFVSNETTFDRACGVVDALALEGKACVIIPITVIFTAP